MGERDRPRTLMPPSPETTQPAVSGAPLVRVRWPWLPAAVAALVVVLTWQAALVTPHLATALGLGPSGAFLDLQGLLAANEAAGRGLDPYALNPLDPYQRPLLYSTWWLWPGHPGLTRADTGRLGYALVAATLAAALLIWRVRSWREAIICIAVLASPAWLLAVYRANNDLVIFVLLALAVWMLQRAGQVWRTIGAALTGAMVILKYYPAAAVIGLLRAPRRRELLALFALVAGIIAVGWPSLVPAFEAISRYGFVVTASVGLQAFGIKVLGESVVPWLPAAAGWIAGLASLFGGYLLAGGSGAARSPGSEDRFMAAAVAGAVMLGCFVIGTSYNYKLVFLWALVPWVLRDAPEALGRNQARALLALLLADCWAGGLAMAALNTLGPHLTRAGRAHALTFFHGVTILVQLGYWVLMGVCLRLALDWSRRQLARLASAP